MGICHGNGPDHCCHLGVHGVCTYLREDRDGPRRWVCTIRARYDSWGEAHHDPDYVRDVKPKLMDCNLPASVNCGDWPQNIPGRLEEGGQGLCCWTEVTLGNLGS